MSSPTAASPAIRSPSCSTPTGSTPRRCRRSRANSICPKRCSCCRRRNASIARAAHLHARRELPFAGHPTVGTAVLLGALDGGKAARVRAGGESRRGPLPGDAGEVDGGEASFVLPSLPTEVTALRRRTTRSPPRSALPPTRSASAIFRTELLDRRQSVPVRAAARPRCGRAAPRPISRRSARWRPTFPGDVRVLARDGEKGHDFHARMFAPRIGITEDPATGSAAAAFAGLLGRFGGYGDGEHRVAIEQGYEMGRPSLITPRHDASWPGSSPRSRSAATPSSSPKARSRLDGGGRLASIAGDDRSRHLSDRPARISSFAPKPWPFANERRAEIDAYFAELQRREAGDLERPRPAAAPSGVSERRLPRRLSRNRLCEFRRPGGTGARRKPACTTASVLRR